MLVLPAYGMQKLWSKGRFHPHFKGRPAARQGAPERAMHEAGEWRWGWSIYPGIWRWQNIECLLRKAVGHFPQVRKLPSHHCMPWIPGMELKDLIFTLLGISLFIPFWMAYLPHTIVQWEYDTFFNFCRLSQLRVCLSPRRGFCLGFLAMLRLLEIWKMDYCVVFVCRVVVF